ncbi:MAG: hypothetical protein ABUL66_03850 [Verrucomicrobiota bacterium]
MSWRIPKTNRAHLDTILKFLTTFTAKIEDEDENEDEPYRGIYEIDGF